MIPAHHPDILRPPTLLEIPSRMLKASVFGKRLHQLLNFSKIEKVLCLQNIIIAEKTFGKTNCIASLLPLLILK